jgi:hypothetical protein
MNSKKSAGPAYGFKVQILNDLMGVKTTDKKMSLLEYLVHNVVAKHFPDLLNLSKELENIEEASKVSLKTVLAECNNIEKGMQLVVLESNKKPNESLTNFLKSNHEKFVQLQINAKTAEVNYKECVEYFGETIQSMDSCEFFAIIWNFLKNFINLASQAQKNLQAAGK